MNLVIKICGKHVTFCNIMLGKSIRHVARSGHSMLALALVLSWPSQYFSHPLSNTDALFSWVRDLGGQVYAEAKLDSNGVRGLYATKAIDADHYIASIPSSGLLNAGSPTDSFAVSILTVLRELKSPRSRFKPFINALPQPGEVVNSCTLDLKYLPMLKSAFWERSIREWQLQLEHLLNGQLDEYLEYTVKETVGNATVTLDDVKYACAIATTRYFSTGLRRRLLMAPVLDLANHDRNCLHRLSDYGNGGFLHLIARAPIKPGDQICYNYGDMRDDYAVVYYGFLPELEDPPRLAVVDHRDHDPESYEGFNEPPSDKPFDGTPAELRAELARLRAARAALAATPDPLPPQPKGSDRVYDLLKELEVRRLSAMDYEIRRLALLLDGEANAEAQGTGQQGL